MTRDENPQAPCARRAFGLAFVLPLAILISSPALAQEPPGVVLTKAIHRYLESDFRGAIQVLQKARSQVQDEAVLADIHLYMGVCYLELGRRSQAARSFTKALEFNPDTALDPERFKPMLVESFLNTKRELMGTLEVSSTVPGRVLVDGVDVGTTPYEGSLTVGTHKVVVLGEEGRRWEASALIRLKGRVALHAEPLPQTGWVKVMSTPPGAAVLLDGVHLGLTPQERIDLSQGKHLLSLVKDGYRAQERPIEVKAGQGSSLEVELSSIAGTIVVTTAPPGALVKLDGSTEGKTPLTLLDVPIGQHTVRVDLEGFDAIERKVEIKDGSTMILNPILIRSGAEEEGVRVGPLLGWIFLGLGVASAGTGMAFGISALQAQQDLEKTVQTSEEVPALIQAGQNRALIADVAYITAGACLITSAVLLITTMVKGEPPPEPQASALGSSLGVVSW